MDKKYLFGGILIAIVAALLFQSSTNSDANAYPAASEQLIHYAATGTANSWQTIYTVPAGKTLKVTNVMVTGTSGTWKFGYANNTVLLQGTASSSTTAKTDFYGVPLAFTENTPVLFYGRQNIDAEEVTVVGWLE